MGSPNPKQTKKTKANHRNGEAVDRHLGTPPLCRLSDAGSATIAVAAVLLSRGEDHDLSFCHWRSEFVSDLVLRISDLKHNPSFNGRPAAMSSEQSLGDAWIIRMPDR